MIIREKEKQALKIVHDFIIKARSFAYEEKDAKFIADFLDEVEYLPALMLEEKDQTEFFQKYAKGICEQFNCNEVFARNKDFWNK